MGLTRLSYDEIILQRILNINSMYPHYWSELLLLAEQLVDESERQQLHEMIFNVEKLVLETEIVPKIKEDGTLIWVERIRGRLSLYDIEMALESNPDYYAYFQKEDGTIVTKFDVERELDKIKNWLYGKVRERSTNRRFSKMR
jgi:hypothetical protein